MDAAERAVRTATHFVAYFQRLTAAMEGFDWAPLSTQAEELFACWQFGRQVFLAGNGGSAGNAIHLATDFLYPVSGRPCSGEVVGQN